MGQNAARDAKPGLSSSLVRLLSHNQEQTISCVERAPGVGVARSLVEWRLLAIIRPGVREVWRAFQPQLPLVLFSVFHLESSATFVLPP